MDKLDIKYLQLLSKSFPSIPATAAEIVRLKAILQLPKITEHFLSDIHGEYSYFTHILKNASGAIHRKINDCFGYQLSDEEKNALALLVYYPERELAAGKRTADWYRVTLYRLVAVCRVATAKYTHEKVRTRLPKDFAYLIEELLDTNEQDQMKKGYFESIIDSVIETGIADRLITSLADLIFRLTVDRLHILGDVFDRGPAAHMVLDDLMARYGVDYVWGNHDILWMGAAMGNPACIANALRNSVKYGNFDTLEDGYGINVRPLALFAMEQYADDPCTAFLPTKVTDCVDEEDSETTAKILKAISVIQFKLEGQLIRRHPEYEMEDRLLLDKMDRENFKVKVGKTVYDTYPVPLPTVDPEDPYRLSPAEEQLVSKLVLTFQRSAKLQQHTAYLMEKGAMYRVCNGNLLYHGCIPMNADGTFTKAIIGGELCSGKGLMDACDRMCRAAMYDRREENTDFMWYLWCGPYSPLNGKEKIATFERTFIPDPEAGHEKKNAYYTLWNEEKTARTIMAEFDIDYDRGHIINGHMPVRKNMGDVPIKANGKFINIDGGMSKAYQPQTGFCGYTLVFNSTILYLAEHQPFDPDAVNSHTGDMISRIIPIERYEDRLLVKDTDGGVDVQGRIDDLTQLLDAYRTGAIRTPYRMQ